MVMMHEFKIMNTRNTEKKGGKVLCRRVASEPSKDHDRGHDRDGVRPLGGKKKSQLMFVVVSCARKELLVNFLLASWSVVVSVTKERYPLIGYPHLDFGCFLIVGVSTQPFY